MKNKPINPKENISLKVGEWLFSKGFDVALFNGSVLEHLNNHRSLLILSPDTKKGIYKKISKNNGKYPLGIIWFDNKEINADSKNWVFEIHSKKNLKQARDLAIEMSKTFDVNISIPIK